MTGKFERLVREEIPIQTASVAMEGGIPSCVTLFDNFLLCYCQSPSPPPLLTHSNPQPNRSKTDEIRTQHYHPKSKASTAPANPEIVRANSAISSTACR